MFSEEYPILGKFIRNESKFAHRSTSLEKKKHSCFSEVPLCWRQSKTRNGNGSARHGDGEQTIQTVAQPLGFREQCWEILCCG